MHLTFIFDNVITLICNNKTRKGVHCLPIDTHM